MFFILLEAHTISFIIIKFQIGILDAKSDMIKRLHTFQIKSNNNEEIIHIKIHGYP